MGKNKLEETGESLKTKVSGKEISKAGKKEELSASETITSMDQKPDKPNLGSSYSSIAASSNSKTKFAPKGPSYTYYIDLPPSNEDDNNNASEEELPCEVVIYNYFMLALVPCQIWL